MALPERSITLPAVLVGQANGRLPASILVDTAGEAGGPTVRLCMPAARSWRALCAAARAAGHVVKATSAADSYRSYEQQENAFRTRYTTTYLAGRPYKTWNGVRWYQRPNTAQLAVPGTSNHGLAVTVDVANASGALLAWLVANAPRFGWFWELQDEPWHIRYCTGDAIPAAVLQFEEGDGMAFTNPVDENNWWALIWRVEALVNNRATVAGGPTVGEVNKLAAKLSEVDAQIEALAIGSGLDPAALKAAILPDLTAEIRDAVADLGEGGATKVRADAE